MRVGLPTGVVQAGVDETITGLWTFANALGLLTDVIGERTGAAGVTVDGVLLRDTTVSLLGFASPANRVLGSDVLGDLDERFRLHAGGVMQWGDGGGARDVELRRDAANELGTPDDFNVGGALDLAGDLELSTSDVTLTTGTKNNQASGTATVLRVLLSTGVVTITGFAGGRAGRVLAVMNLGGSNLTLSSADVNSLAANRMLFTLDVDHVLQERDIALLWYDDGVSRWKLLSSTV